MTRANSVLEKIRKIRDANFTEGDDDDDDPNGQDIQATISRSLADQSSPR